MCAANEWTSTVQSYVDASAVATIAAREGVWAPCEQGRQACVALARAARAGLDVRHAGGHVRAPASGRVSRRVGAHGRTRVRTQSRAVLLCVSSPVLDMTTWSTLRQAA